MRIGGVVDRDFRSNAEATVFANGSSIFVLPVHEVENFFLHPGTIDLLLAQNGRGQVQQPMRGMLLRDFAIPR